MNQKVGRNDPCTCGSGKKYKSCCMLKDAAGKKPRGKITAKWLNQPQGPNLMERTFGQAISGTGKSFKASKTENDQIKENDQSIETEQDKEVKPDDGNFSKLS